MGNLNYIVFGGVDSRDYGIYISGEGVFNAPERDVEVVNIPGKDGDLLIDRGRFLNIQVTYPGFNFEPDLSTFAERLRAFRAALASQTGYQRLEDSFHPDEFRLASFRSGLDINPVMYNTASTFDIAFDCKPQRFLKSGEEEIDPSEWGETETKTGEIVSFEAESNTGIKSLVVGIEPNQSGSGDPSPDNIRPISGYDTVKISQMGNGLFYPTQAVSQTVDGITIVSSGGAFHIYGTATSRAISNIFSVNPLTFPSDSAYKLYLGNTVDDSDVEVSFMNGATRIDYWLCSGVNRDISMPQSAMSGQTCDGLRFKIANGATVDIIVAPYIAKAGDVEETSISLGQTVYGGTLDLVSGVLTVTHEIYSFTGNETIATATIGGYTRFGVSNVLAQNVQTDSAQYAYCSHFKCANSPMGGNAIDNAMGAYQRSIYWRADSFADANAMKTYFANQSSSETPCVYVGKLATPLTYQLTAETIQTLLGTNNIWADTGDVSVEIGEDPNILVNPTPFEALPLFEVVGTGSLTVGNTTIGITGDSTQDIFIDSDIMEAYEDDNGAIISRNDRINLSGTDFPKLGEETRVESNGLTSVKITPRWWTI